jgi:hypothetical protein
LIAPETIHLSEQLAQYAPLAAARFLGQVLRRLRPLRQHSGKAADLM